MGQRQLNRGSKGWTIFTGPPGSAAGILTGYGYAEQIGEGMQLFKRECDRHPFKPKYPEYREWADTTVTVLHPAEVIVAKEEIPLEELNERQKKNIEYIKKKGSVSNKESF